MRWKHVRLLLETLESRLNPSGNLIVNGDFSQGNTGFQSLYTRVDGNIGGAQTYDVATGWSVLTYGDHTTGSGRMLGVNGSNVANIAFWSQSVSVTPNTDYTYSFWVSSWYPGPTPLAVKVDDITIATAQAPAQTGQWQKVSVAWNSGAKTSATFSMLATQGFDIGGDFAIDDIALEPILRAGPGDIVTDSFNTNNDVLAIDLAKPISLPAGTYRASAFNRQIASLESGESSGSITPALVVAQGGGYVPVAVGDSATYSGAAGFSSTTFGGSDTFTLVQATTVYAAIYWRAPHYVGGPYRMPVGYANSSGSSLVFYAEGYGTGGALPYVGLACAGTSQATFARSYDFSVTVENASPTSGGSNPGSGNLIANGDFSLGNTGFGSQYVLTPGNIGGAQTYDVATSWNVLTYGDHTTGAGKMLGVNGSNVANVIFWHQKVAVLPNTDYNFSFWTSSWFPGATPLAILVDGTTIGTGSAPAGTAQWQQITVAWNSGNRTFASFSFAATQGFDIGGDFAIDDISLVRANRPPVFSSLSNQSDLTGNQVSFSIASAFSDPDSDTLTFTATGLPTGLSISSAGLISGTISSTANASSPFTTRITASDGRGGSVTGSFIWTVTPPNRNPVAGTLANQTSSISDTVNLSIASVFSDPDNDKLTFSASNLPPGLSISSAGVITGSFTPSANPTNSYIVSITANDGRGGSTVGSFTWSVASIFAVGPGNTVNGAYDGASNLLAVDLNRPIQLSAGTYNASKFFRELSSLAPMQTTITPVLLVSSGDGYKPVAVGSALRFSGLSNYSAVDFGGRSRFTLNQNTTVYGGIYWAAPQGGVMPVAYTGNGQSLVYYGGGTGAGAATPVVGVQVSSTGQDFFGRTYDFAIEVRAIDPNANQEPLFSSLNNRSDSAGTQVSFSAASAFSDPDSDTLTFTATGLPTGLSISSAGLISGTISSTANASSPFTTQITASDGRGGSVTGSFTWTVTAPNRNPVVGTLANQTSTITDTVNLSIASAFSDPDSDTLTFTATGLPTGLSISSAGLISGTISSTANASSPFTTQITASDGRGGSVTGSFTWTVTPPNRSPVAGNLPNRTAWISGAINISVASMFSDPDNDSLTFSAANLPPGLAISSNGNITGTVLSSANSSIPYSVLITAVDGRGGTATGSFSWTILAGPPNVLATVGPGNVQTQRGGGSNNLVVVDLSNPMQLAAGSYRASLFSREFTDFSNYNGESFPTKGDVIPMVVVKNGDSYQAIAIGEANTYTGRSDFGSVPFGNSDTFSLNSPTTVYGGIYWSAPFDGIEYRCPVGYVNVNSASSFYYYGVGKASLTNQGPEFPRLNTPFTGSGSGLFSQRWDFSIGISQASGGGTPGNRQPVFSSLENRTTIASSQVGFSVTQAFSDPDSDTLSFTATGLPAGLSISSAGQISGTISSAAASSTPYTVRVTASDNRGGSVTGSFTWTVLALTNSFPAVMGPGNIRTEAGGGSHNLIVIDLSNPISLPSGNYRASQFGRQFTDFTNFNGESFATTGNVVPMVVTKTSDSYQPIAIGSSINYAGPTSFSSVVFGGNDSFTLNTATTVFGAFYWSAPFDGIEYRCPIGYVNSTDNSSFYFHGVGVASNVNQGPSFPQLRTPFTSVISGPFSQRWDFNVEIVQASSGGGNNRPPVVSSLPERSDFAGNNIQLSIAQSFSDPDSDSLSFSASGLPDGLSISPTGTIAGTISNSAIDFSPYTTRITANDGRGGFVTGSFIWTISLGSSIPSNPAFDLIGLRQLRSNPATSTIDGSGIGVVVIDSGLDYTHALFQSGTNPAYFANLDDTGKLVPVGRNFAGDAKSGSFVPGDPRNRFSSSRFNDSTVNQRNADYVGSGDGFDFSPVDTNGHGTHVAGIIGARNPEIGVATGAKLIGLKVLGADGTGSNEDILKALAWVRDNASLYNIKVVNMSLGYGFFQFSGPDDPFLATIADLESLGITVVSAAGNLYGLTPTERNSSTPGISSTLTVGAVWKDGSVTQAYWPEGDTFDYTTGPGRLASFSQRPADSVDNGIFAPGAFMLSAIPNNGLDSSRANDMTAELAGTSQAAPVVSGVVALMQDAAFRAGGRYLTPIEVRQILFQTATVINDGDNEDDGFSFDPSTQRYELDNNTNADYRLINANNAVAMVRSMFDTPNQNDDPNGVITSPVELSPDYTRIQIADINPALDPGDPLRYTPVVANFNGEIGKDGDTIVGDNDVDLYAFTVSMAGSLIIRTSRASSAPVNTQLRLFDSAGNEITSNVDNRDDNDPSTDSNGLFDPFSTLTAQLEPGRYFIGVSGQGNGFYNPTAELSGIAGTTILDVKATGAYQLTMDYVTQDPNGLLPGAKETFLQVTGAAVQRGFLGGDYLSSPAEIPFPSPDQLDPLYGGTVVDAGAIGIDGKLSHTISTKVTDVDLFIMTAPDNGFISFDIDSLDYTTSNNDIGMAADTFVRAWRVEQDGTLTELGFNDNGFNPDERLIRADGQLASDTNQSTALDAFLKVAVTAGDRIVFGVSDRNNQGYSPLNLTGRQSVANSHVGFYDAFATFSSNDINGRIGTDVYNLDATGAKGAIGILPTALSSFSIGFDDQSFTAGPAKADIGAKDVDFYAYSASSTGTLLVDVDSIEANLPDSVGTIITIFEIVVDANGFRTLNVVGTSADSSGIPTGTDPKLGVQVTAGRQYYVAISGAGNTSFNPFRQASGTAAFATGSYRLQSSFLAQNTVVSDAPVTVFRPANRTRFSSARLGYDASGTKVSGNDLDTFIYTPTGNGQVSISVLPGAESAASPSFRVFRQNGTGPYVPVNSTVGRPGTISINVTAGTKYAIVTSGSRGAINTSANGVTFQSTGGTRGTTGNYTVSIDDSKLTTAPPVLSGPPSRSFTISSNTTLQGFTLSDADAGATISTLTASVDRGTLSGGGKSGASITLTGTLTQLNASLAQLAFRSANFDASQAKLTLTAKDASGNSASLISSLSPTENLVTTIADPQLAGKRSALVVGTARADVMTITGSGSNYRVSLNGRVVNLTGITGRILSFGLAGNDTIDMPSVSIATISYGGDGNDIIRAGAAADWIFGENGADLLAGGMGADQINGGADNDLLFDGTVAAKSNALSLASTLSLWTTISNPTNSNYTTIFNRLNVTADKSSRDNVQGLAGLDLFFASASDILDRIASERTRFA